MTCIAAVVHRGEMMGWSGEASTTIPLPIDPFAAHSGWTGVAFFLTGCGRKEDATGTIAMVYPSGIVVTREG